MIESLLKPLVELVHAHYASPKGSEPFLLSRLGVALGSGRQDLVTHYGSLALAISAAGPSVLEIVGRDQPGRETVVTPEVRDEISRKLGERTPAVGADFDNLPAPLKIAFCLKVEPGQQVAVQTSAPVKYVRLPDDADIPAGYVVIEEKFREPGLHLDDASNSDKERLWRLFSRWAEEHQLNHLLPNHRPPTMNALERLLAAQPADILTRMNLPADIVAILLRHS